MLEYAGYVGTVEAEDGAFAGRVLGCATSSPSRPIRSLI